MPWKALFHQPIEIPGAQPLKTLADARAYVLALPDKERKKAHWEVVAQTLMVEGASRLPHTMLTDIAMRQALAGGKFEPERRGRKPNVKKRNQKKAVAVPKVRGRRLQTSTERKARL